MVREQSRSLSVSVAKLHMKLLYHAGEKALQNHMGSVNFPAETTNLWVCLDLNSINWTLYSHRFLVTVRFYLTKNGDLKNLDDSLAADRNSALGAWIQNVICSNCKLVKLNQIKSSQDATGLTLPLRA